MPFRKVPKEQMVSAAVHLLVLLSPSDPKAELGNLATSVYQFQYFCSIVLIDVADSVQNISAIFLDCAVFSA